MRQNKCPSLAVRGGDGAILQTLLGSSRASKGTGNRSLVTTERISHKAADLPVFCPFAGDTPACPVTSLFGELIDSPSQ